MNSEEKKEKEFWKRIDQKNKIYQSSKAFFAGGFFIIFFSSKFIELYQSYSSYAEFKTAIRTVEKVRSLGFLLAIAVGIYFIWFGIKIRKSPVSEKPRDLP